MLSTTRKVLGILVAFMLILVSIPVLFALPAQEILFQPQPYLRALQDQNYYQNFPGWLADMAINNGLGTIRIKYSVDWGSSNIRIFLAC